MRLAALILLTALAGCTEAGFYRRPTDGELRTLIWENDLTVAQQTYLLKLKKQPTEFDLSQEDARDAWDRAGAFIQSYAGMKLAKKSRYEIRTNTRVAQAGFVPKTCDAAYLVTREPLGDKMHFTVRTFVSAPDWVPCELGRIRNAYILSQYIRTGELPHPELIQK